MNLAALRAALHVHLPADREDLPAYGTLPLYTDGRDRCRCGATRYRFLVYDFRADGSPFVLRGDWHGGRPGTSALAALTRAAIAAAALALFLLWP